MQAPLGNEDRILRRENGERLGIPARDIPPVAGGGNLEAARRLGGGVRWHCLESSKISAARDGAPAAIAACPLLGKPVSGCPWPGR